MNILIPMAGAGQRFKDAGYTVHKPAIMTTDYRDGIKKPMVVCATMDLPDVESNGANIIYVDRDFHKTDGVEAEIKNYMPECKFITTNCLTDGQAATCLLAEKYINNDLPLLIAGCDNGMLFDLQEYRSECRTSDVLVFTYRHNEAVVENPNAYGWVKTDEDKNITGLSIKKAISDNPKEDHAIVATFWFKKGRYFVEAAKQMIEDDDRINGEFYVDEVIKYTISMGLRVRVFEIDRYLGWGTPKDYENYEKTLAYWRGFVESDYFIGM